MSQTNNHHPPAQATPRKVPRLDQQELLGIIKCAAEDRGITTATLIRLLSAHENNGPEPDPGPTVAEWAKQHIARKAATGAKTSDATRKAQLKKLTNRYGDVPLREFAHRDAVDFRDWCVGSFSRGTVHTIMSIVSAMFGDAVEAEIIPANPFTRLKIQRAMMRERFLSKEECRVLIEACATFPWWLRDFVTLALDTGMRKNEILTLERRDVHLEMGTHGALSVRSERSKSKKARIVPMTPRVRQIVDRLSLNAQPAPTAILLSPSIAGGKIPEHRLDYHWKRVCRKARFQNLHIHDLRHTFASLLIQEGVDIAPIQILLGHSSRDMTLRYAHLNLDSLVKAMKVLGNGHKGAQQ